MGLNVKDLIVKKEISIAVLHGKVLAVDSMNMLYQFLTTIRAPDGSVLTDRKGQVTSHLIGLFSRTTALMEQGLKLIFVFDGTPPEIKRKTWEKRSAVKKEAALKFTAAEKAGDVAEMRKYASRTSILTKEMIRDAQRLLKALGLPIVQAPSEGEAQTAFMVRKGAAYASVSQDYDNLIFGCPLLVRNVSIEGRRKKAGTLSYQKVNPELISLKEVLQHAGIELDQLILLAILVGTDYNPGGVKGIGPKTALKLVQKFPHDHDALFNEVDWKNHYPDLEWREVFNTIKHIPVTEEYHLEWKRVDVEGVVDLLVKEHDFAEERVRGKVERLAELQKKQAQTGLAKFW